MYTTAHSNFSLLPYGHSRIKLNTDFYSIHLIRIVFNINAVQYQTGPIHESDNHIFAKIPGGVRTSGSAHGHVCIGLLEMCENTVRFFDCLSYIKSM